MASVVTSGGSNSLCFRSRLLILVKDRCAWVGDASLAQLAGVCFFEETSIVLTIAEGRNVTRYLAGSTVWYFNVVVDIAIAASRVAGRLSG